MKKDVVHFVFILFLFINPLISRGGVPPIVKWKVKNPFGQKLFIENKGQYEVKDKVKPSEILFGAQQDGLQYYFTPNAIWIDYYATVKLNQEEELKQQSEENVEEESGEKQLPYKTVEQFHEMFFQGANPDVKIISNDEVNWYYNFYDGKITIKAHAWKKIIYRNLYPNIDMEIYFPEDKQGFKYVFVVHPGADVSQIKIQYPLSENINMSVEGNVIIKSEFGDFTDHKPEAIETGSQKVIGCSFKYSLGAVEFNVGDHDKTNQLIIDPWVATPTFTGTNSAYDLDWDYAGNCYIYGGSCPWQLMKFNNTGTLLWTFIGTYDVPTNLCCYGGFVVDHNTQSVYICQGYREAGARNIKLNSSGNVVNAIFGNDSTNELWRMAFDECKQRVVIVGGGTTTPTNNGAVLDTNLTAFKYVNMFNFPGCCDDVWGVILDRSGAYAYLAGVNTVNNQLYKVSLPLFSPIIWQTHDGYNFMEKCCSQFNYAFGTQGYGHCGYNGLAASDTGLYSWDGFVLKKWNTSNGSLLTSATVSNLYLTNADSTLWGGIASDLCDNVFVGFDKDIIQFDGSTLTPVDTIKGTNVIYDVKLSNNNLLYACGANFVEAIQLTLPACNPVTVQNQVNNPNCSTQLGSVTVTPNGGFPGYIIIWNTIPVQTGTTANNLNPGTYIATIQDNSCPPIIVYDTVQILPPPIVPKVTVDSPSTCSGTDVSLIVKGATTYIWSPTTGLNTSTGDSVIANTTITTTYTVIGSLSDGCSDTIKSLVTIHPLPVIQLTPAVPSICIGQRISWNATGALSYTWSPSTGLSSTTGNNVILNPTSTTTYSISGTDSLGCISTISTIASVDSLPSASFVINTSSQCTPQQVQFTNTSIGGVTYLWNFGDGTTDNSENPTHNYNKTGIYNIEITVTTAAGCSDSTTMTDSVKSVNYGVHIGNAFLPGSSDNINNIFKPQQILCNQDQNYIFRIYSRWGELLYETSDPNDGWDGTYKGQKESVDVYVYYIQYTCGPCTQFIKGNVTLLR